MICVFPPRWREVVIAARIIHQVKLQTQAAMDATREILQENVDEVGEGLAKQLKEGLEEHRRVPHVGGARVDDLQRRVKKLEGK